MSKEHFEKYTNAQLTELIRSAMREGCIKPCHVYDAVDILLDRLSDKPRRNCDVGDAYEQNKRFARWRKHEGCDSYPEIVLRWSQKTYEEGEVK